MKPFASRCASLLLCLLACTSPSDASRSEAGQAPGPSRPPASTAALTADSGTSPWKLTAPMTTHRSGHTATLLLDGKVLVVGGHGGLAPPASTELYDPATGTWSTTGSLLQARQQHTATLLPDGKVLVVGGKNPSGPLATTEVYDPVTGTWSPGRGLERARFNHTATTLTDGRVLVVAGSDGTSVLASAEVYDPAANTWSPVSALARARERHTATLLPGNKLLVVAGREGAFVLASAEVYDPAANTWSPAGALARAREFHTTTLLPGGKVLVVAGRDEGGVPLASTEEYDVATGTWSPAAALSTSRAHHSAVLLPDGTLLVVGGFHKSPWSVGSVVAAELYAPRTRTWSSAAQLKWGRLDVTATLLSGGQVLVAGGLLAEDEEGVIHRPEVMTEVYTPAPAPPRPAGTLSQVRLYHTATLLPDGRVLVVGGGDRRANVFTAVDLYDPASSSWSTAASLTQARSGHTATLLPEGRVLVVGGTAEGGAQASAELYDPTTGTWSPTGALKQARGTHTATLLSDGRVLVVGGAAEGGARASAELYDPAKGTWSLTGSLKQGRERHTATLLPDGRVLVVGGRHTTEMPLKSAELYDPVSGEWSPAPSMRHAHVFHTTTLLTDGRVLVAGGVDGSRTSMAFTELYDPGLGVWFPAGALTYSRTAHSATLLPGGRILVVGGWGSSGSYPPDEIYDLSTELWTAAGSPVQAREYHTATLLPGGKMLVVGGNELTDSVLYGDFEVAPGDTTWRPLLTGVRLTDVEHGTSITVTGGHFRGGSESHGGQGRSSSANHPLLSVSSVDSGRWMPLRGRDFSDASLSATLPHLPNGHHLVHVTTRGVTSSWMISIINRALPGARLTESPAPATQDSTARFAFSTVAPALFECNLDGTGFSVCISPLRYAELKEGEHVFQVRARNAVGNLDTTPAEFRWTVDRTNPETSIDGASRPPPLTNEKSAHFSFSSSEKDVFFECRLDGDAFGFCSNPHLYSDVLEGTHTLQARAIDKAGNVDPTAAEYRWTVDTRPPQRPELAAPTPDQRLFIAEPVFKGTAEPDSTVTVFVDGIALATRATANKGGYWTLVSPALEQGLHQATATATDPAGNTSAVSLEVSFAILQRGYYGLHCAASPSPASAWPFALLLLGLSRRRRSP